MYVKKVKSRGYLHYLTLLLFLIIFLLFSLFLSVSLGAVKINLFDTYRIVFSKLGWFSDIGNLSKSSIAIVWNMRVPRV
ncbi:iron ABC transporter permease, partial [Streptococcus gordonii]|nr:iron ABC transporter permease [Streptococcus gordonii]